MIKYWHMFQDKYSIFCPYYWRDLKYKISCFFNHRNKWVIKAIPREWRDKDTVFEEILFAGIINFVEGEEALTTVEWSKEHEEKILEIYHWAKTGRHELEKKMMAAYPKENPIFKDGKFNYTNCSKKSYEELYGEVNRLENLLNDTNTKHLVWLIENRAILWT
jgi:hypothetical protein